MLVAALMVALHTWGPVCGGQEFPVTYAPLPPLVNAQSTWSYPGDDPYADPASNHDCRIVVNSTKRWTSRYLCTVIVHEIGHLAGQPHSTDPADVMYPTPTRIFPGCV